MIGVPGGKSMAALQQKSAELEQRVEMLSAQLATVGEKLTGAVEQLDAHAIQLVGALQHAEKLAAAVADQAAALKRLDKREEKREELDRRVHADMVRIERQAALDVEEFRRTTVALASRLLAAEKGQNA